MRQTPQNRIYLAGVEGKLMVKETVGEFANLWGWAYSYSS